MENVLTWASAFPDPPFEVQDASGDTGFDADLMRALCHVIGVSGRLVKYAGDDFNGIFKGLANGSYDAVISGTTITPERQAAALFSDPYLEFNQGLLVDRSKARAPHGVPDLKGEAVGIQIGNTSDVVARKLLAEGVIGRIQYYPYDGIETALNDLSAGRLAAIIKLVPVATWLARSRPGLAVVQEFPTHEQLGIAFNRDSAALRAAVNAALAHLKLNGTFEALRRRWLS